MCPRFYIFGLQLTFCCSLPLTLKFLLILTYIFFNKVVFNLSSVSILDMSSALSMFHNQYSMPVLVAENKIRTKTGNALCICLESIGTTFLNGTIITGNIFLKCKYYEYHNFFSIYLFFSFIGNFYFCY